MPGVQRTGKRPSASERGYDHDWAKLREWRLTRNPVCEHCEAAGKVSYEGLIVDHKIPVHVRPDLRLDIDNTQTLCRSCHARKTEADIAKYGPPRW